MSSSLQDFRPRLILDISENQFFRLQKIPWGLKRHVFNAIIDSFLAVCDEHGMDNVVGLLVTKALSINDLCGLKLKKGTADGDNL